MSNNVQTPLGFLGHTDTVDANDDWQYEKFNLTKIDNKIYGLGVCDMKSGISAMISAISQINVAVDRRHQGLILQNLIKE